MGGKHTTVNEVYLQREKAADDFYVTTTSTRKVSNLKIEGGRKLGGEMMNGALGGELGFSAGGSRQLPVSPSWPAGAGLATGASRGTINQEGKKIEPAGNIRYGRGGSLEYEQQGDRDILKKQQK